MQIDELNHIKQDNKMKQNMEAVIDLPHMTGKGWNVTLSAEAWDGLEEILAIEKLDRGEFFTFIHHAKPKDMDMSLAVLTHIASYFRAQFWHLADRTDTAQSLKTRLGDVKSSVAREESSSAN